MLPTYMDDYVVAVPSYNRLATFTNKTLAFLKRHNIPMEKIYLFVANEAEAIVYKDTVPNIVVAEIGLVNARNFIFRHFPVGKWIVSFDDDVEDIYQLTQDNILISITDLHEFIMKRFIVTCYYKARLWGVYPVANFYFMNHKTTTDLKFIVGSFWGCVNPGADIQIEFGQGCKEDYQRCILFYLKDKKIIRFNNYAVKSATYKTPGGLNTPDRLRNEQEVVKQILDKWGHLVRLNTRRKSPFPELLFKRGSLGI